MQIHNHGFFGGRPHSHGMPWFHGTSMWILNSSHFKRSPTRRKPQQVSCPGRDRFVRLVNKSGNNYRKHSPSPFHGKMPWVSCRVSLKIIHWNMMHKPVFLVVHPLESGTRKWGYNPVVESVEGITQEAGAFFFLMPGYQQSVAWSSNWIGKLGCPWMSDIVT